ncbi:MAG: ATP-binding cassette domain-containing protein [Geminicoccaceae bacterium]
MTGSVLAVEKLAKRFGGVVATDDVDLTIETGSLQCIIGPNGAGKSTLFSLLCGIQKPDAGRIILKGEDITRLPSFARVRKGLGLTFQTNRSYVELDVRQNLAIPMTNMRGARGAGAAERYRYALELFGFAEDDPTPVRELAHDRRQWLEILMVLAGGPELLLLDEPTAGMSPDETRQTAKVLRHLNESGLSIIVVEHDIAFVREVAKRLTVLHQGRVFADGPLDEITGRQDVRDIYLGRA